MIPSTVPHDPHLLRVPLRALPALQGLRRALDECSTCTRDCALALSPAGEQQATQSEAEARAAARRQGEH